MEILIIILISGVFALLQIFKIKDRFSQAIHGLFVVSIALSFVEMPAVRMDGFYLFGMTLVGVVIYALHNTEFHLKKRILLSAMAIIQLVGIVFILSLWPYTVLALSLSLVSVGLFIYAVVKDSKSYKNEIGFMVVMLADAIVKLITVAAIFKS